jgi:hypothetical protein
MVSENRKLKTFGIVAFEINNLFNSPADLKVYNKKKIGRKKP